MFSLNYQSEMNSFTKAVRASKRNALCQNKTFFEILKVVTDAANGAVTLWFDSRGG